MSELRNYAEREMKRAGLYEEDTDYGPGEIAKCVLGMIDAFSLYGHSGGSAEMTLAIFDKVVRFQPLTDLTNDPDEWMPILDDLWQSRRYPACFSTDGGKTYYNIDKGRETIYTSAERVPS